MKTLLLDNYDSFSHILFQYLWEINGEKPHFIRNDALTLPEIRALEFDNIVISPGPGRPDVARDFGICGDGIAAFADTPILGVCLGHQGLALAAGARVAVAPAPRHGKPSRILHDGQGLFAGLPQGFSAVRYHSLAVARDGAPPELEITARAEDDGQVMGLRLKYRPGYGVQFHPESVGTEWGKRILFNFKALTGEWLRERGRGGPRPRRESPTGPLPPAPPRPRGPDARGRPMTVRELPWRDPEAAFVRFFARLPAAFWLDSQAAPSASAPGRYSYLGSGDRLLETRGDETAVRMRTPEGFPSAQISRGDPFDFLDGRLRAQAAWTLPETHKFRGAFRGGLVGCFGYGLKAFAGIPAAPGTPQPGPGTAAPGLGTAMPGPGTAAPGPGTAPTGPGTQAAFPDAVFIEPDCLIAFDHDAQSAFVIAPDTAAGRAWSDEVALSWPALETPDDLRLTRTGADPRGLEGLQIPWIAAADKARYLDSIRDLQSAIFAGESYEACLTNEISVAGGSVSAADPLQVYRILRRTNPAPYAAFLRLPQGCVLSASPERFLKLDGGGVLTCRPIKGTRRRGADDAEDAALRRELAQSVKERSENLMIVDLVRNDFGRVCALGSVRVPESMVVEDHPTVFQLVSQVEGRLEEGRTALEAVRACFPGGSMTGAPKLRTMELLEARERRARGIFSGALGYLGADGTLDLGMTIRTLVWEPERESGSEPQAFRYTVGCGGAILAESDPEAEYAETLLKAMAPLRALELAVFGRGGGWKIQG